MEKEINRNPYRLDIMKCGKLIRESTDVREKFMANRAKDTKIEFLKAY